MRKHLKQTAALNKCLLSSVWSEEDLSELMNEKNKPSPALTLQAPLQSSASETNPLLGWTVFISGGMLIHSSTEEPTQYTRSPSPHNCLDFPDQGCWMDETKYN